MGWTALLPLHCKYPLINFMFGTSIWISCDGDIDPGMVEYDCVTNTLKAAIPFKSTDNFFLSCTYDARTIALVSMEAIVIFDVATKQYTKRIPIKPFDMCTAMIKVRDCIHMFGGPNKKGHYAIFSKKDESTKLFVNRCPSQRMLPSVIKRI